MTDPANQALYWRASSALDAVRPELLRLRGVTGVAVGPKEVAGERSVHIAILVFVKKKGSFDEGERVPPSIEGIVTDVIEAEFRHHNASLPDCTRYPKVRGGASIEPFRAAGGPGTLGMEVVTADGAQALLSAYHVMCGDPSWNRPASDRRIIQPWKWCGGWSGDVIGRIVDGAYGQIPIQWGYDLYVDCAICDTSGREATPGIVQVGNPTGVKVPDYLELVMKYGAATGNTWGVVTSLNWSGPLEGTDFFYQYLITPVKGLSAFSLGGDSGSVVVNADRKVIGLVIGGDDYGRNSIVTPFSMIQRALGVNLPRSASTDLQESPGAEDR